MINNLSSALAKLNQNKPPKINHDAKDKPSVDQAKAGKPDKPGQDLHHKLKQHPEQREAVYKQLTRTEPALINHLEKWRREDEAGEPQAKPDSGKTLTEAVDRLRTRQAIREAFGEPARQPEQTVTTLPLKPREPGERFENSLTPLPNGRPKERFDNSLTPLPNGRPQAWEGVPSLSTPTLRDALRGLEGGSAKQPHWTALKTTLLDARAGIADSKRLTSVVDFFKSHATQLFGVRALGSGSEKAGSQPADSSLQDIAAQKEKVEKIEAQIDKLNEGPKTLGTIAKLGLLHARAAAAKAELNESIEAELQRAASQGPRYPGDHSTAEQRMAARAEEIKALAPNDPAFAERVEQAQTNVSNDRVVEASAHEVQRVYDEKGSAAAAQALDNLKAAHPELADDIERAAQSTVDKIEENDQAIAKINEKLNGDGLSEDEVKEIANLLEDMHPADLNKFISELPDDKLEKMLDEMDSNGHLFNGFDDGIGDGERGELLEAFAEGLDAQNLNRVMQQWPQFRTEFADAIAKNASDATKVELVSSLKGNSEDNGLAIAKIIAGISDPAQITAALNELDELQLQHVISAASQIKTEIVKEGGTSIIDPQTDKRVTTAEPGPLVEFLETAARSDDPAVKAAVFEEGARQLAAIEPHGPTAEVRQALTEVLESDPIGIMDHLETNDRTGEALSTYMRFMLEAGDIKPIQEMAKTLMGGNVDSIEDVLAFLEQKKEVGNGREPVYQNAESLGYFFGAIESGAHLWGASAEDTANALALFGDYFPFAAPVIENIGARIAEGRLEEGQLLIDALLPGGFDSVIETVLNDAYLRVSERNS
jgi:hypothetical protein